MPEYFNPSKGWQNVAVLRTTPAAKSFKLKKKEYFSILCQVFFTTYGNQTVFVRNTNIHYGADWTIEKHNIHVRSIWYIFTNHRIRHLEQGKWLYALNWWLRGFRTSGWPGLDLQELFVWAKKQVTSSWHPHTNNHKLRPGPNPMNGLQACIYKLVNTSVFKSLKVTCIVRFNLLMLLS